jgi:glycerol uptake facilitator-like aquaporin
LASLKKFPLKKIPIYLLAQYLGSFLAALVIFSTYYEAINAYDNGSRTAYYDKLDNNLTVIQTDTGSIFSTYPASHVTIHGSLLDQIVATFMLMFAICAVTDEKGINTPKHLQPLILALVITAICIAFGLNCGAILNPARDLAPRIFTVLAGYGIQPFR